ncbi:MAG: cation acetate symporter [Gemmataceae bacterium]|jgi:cation/acetate symporter|nr:cation acetate symporter [Gemmataceae bacterium]
MIHLPSTLAIVVFCLFVGLTLGLSFYFGRRTRSSAGYFAAHGSVPWWINGVAFAGDYLSAASFLGICGMIAFFGYDGFLYSIGYLAGWVVALFVVAEPLKRLGKYTFADALNARFRSRGLKLVVAISTLVVSLFYLIPQMVGAGVLIRPLLGLPHYAGVLLVGAVVILIVTTAGMVSTTYVQFLKGLLLVLFSTVLSVLILDRGLSTQPNPHQHQFVTIGPFPMEKRNHLAASDLPFPTAQIIPPQGGWIDKPYVRVQLPEGVRTFRIQERNPQQIMLSECQTLEIFPTGRRLVNGIPQGTGEGEGDLFPVGTVKRLPENQSQTGSLGPISFFSTIQESEILLWGEESFTTEGIRTTIYFQKPTSGKEILTPGNLPAFKGIRSESLGDKLNFLSLLLALFCGTASLPHILIRYYTVRDAASARKSTVVGIGTIGFFYILTLIMGLGAMTSGALDVTDSNMAAPLLARSFGEFMFAVISAIAFTTVLGTVSGLIVAASGTVAHDLLKDFLKWNLSDTAQVRAGKITAIGVGAMGIVLGILFQKMNVNFLVGWAFSVAASANLPALVMLLFWKRTTKQGVIASVTVGMLSSLTWILLSADTFKNVYKLPVENAIVPFSQPGIVTIPLSFLVLVVVSWLTPNHRDKIQESV